MERLGAAARAIGRGLGSGPGAGALTMAALFVVDLVTGEVAFLGQRDARAVALVMEHARRSALQQQILVLVTLVVLGCLFGALGAAVGRAWDWALRRASPRFGALRGVVVTLALHAFFLTRSIVEYPQLYSAHFYAKQGLRKAAMVYLTEHWSVRGLNVAAIVFLAAALLVPLAWRARDVVTWSRRNLRVVLGIPTVVMLGALAIVVIRARRRRPSTTSMPGRPNVLLVAIDSLRADRVFGPDAAARFPNLARLAQQGVRFRNAYVSQARTLPSFVTLLTGRYPQHHGIRHEFPSAAVRQQIGPSVTSVAHDAGWRTAAVSDFAGEIFARVPLGIEDVDVARFNLYAIVEGSILNAHVTVLPYAASSLGESVFPAMRAMAEYADPELLVDRANDRLDAAQGKPFFVTVFFSGTHSPYVAPAPYYRSFGDPAYRGPYRYLKQPLPLVPMLPPVDARQVQALYDGSLAAVDTALGRLLRRLEADGTAQNTIVVLLGDHGENLFDGFGRGMGHGDHLLGDLANQIPLVIVDPVHAYPAHDVDGVVRDVDLAPTLAGLLGLAPPSNDGVDLAPLLRGEGGDLDLRAFEETGLWFIGRGPGFQPNDRLPYPDVWHLSDIEPSGEIFVQPRWEDAVVFAKHRAVRTARWKLLYQPTLNGPRFRLFDLLADPEQSEDVASAHPEALMALRVELEAWMAR